MARADGRGALTWGRLPPSNCPCLALRRKVRTAPLEVTMNTTLSRRHWREAIWLWLERWNPVQSRWLQEHPRREEILNELTTEVIDLWLHALKLRAATPLVPSVWTSTSEADLESTVVSLMLETPELWPDLDEDYPRTPLPPEAPPMMLQTIPVFNPIVPPSPHQP